MAKAKRRRNPGPWFNKGARAGRSGKYSDMYSAWKAQKGKPKTYTPSGAVSGKGVEAKEYFFEGYLSVPEFKRKNPLSVGLPRNKWVNARIRVTSGGKIQATVDENILGNLFGGKSKNKRKRTAQRKR